jgi:hypothetical protein
LEAREKLVEFTLKGNKALSHRRLIIRIFILASAFITFTTNSIAFAANTPKSIPNSKQVAQFDADDSYDPFADYSDFDSAQEEEEDINFFRNGRFVTLALLLGARGWTGNLAKLYSTNANYGIGLTYFFDLRFAAMFSFTTSSHTFAFTSSDGPHGGSIGIQNFGLDLKYYIVTQNVTKGLGKFNPFILVGFSEVLRTTNSPDTSAYGKDSANAFDLGGGIEFPLMRNKMFFGFSLVYQLVNFANEGSQLVTANGVQTGIYPSGDSYLATGTLGINF